MSIDNNDPPDIFLRKVKQKDLEVFFQNQLDPDANWMAAFTSKDPSDRAAFDAHWEKIISNETVLIRTIIFEKQVAGSVLKYKMAGEPEVSYWIGKEFWGKGIATAALEAFLQELPDRPVNARAAADNLGSIRVLEKCGFKKIGTDRYFANARGEEIEEVIMRLD